MAQEPATNVPQDVLSGNYTHYRPLKTGLSARIPLTEKLSVTTGLTYSLYCSRFTYSLSGEKAQQAHYLGIPIRLDWMLASNRWLDVYVGAGVAGDLCVGSALGGNAFAKDGPSFSVLGAGGLQWNMTPRIGLYVEPELSWTAPSDRHVLRTYRQEHPLVFTVATGLRINLGKQ
jgi:opacity protein-like surface antigen